MNKNNATRPLLSVIVPIYNVEEYLERCIESILKQVFQNFELILINDGSIDKSGFICDKYKAKDKRIIVIHQHNSGVSSARNAGLKIARGIYISFIDPDDWIDKEMYAKMIDGITKATDIDLVCIHARSILETGDIISSKNNCPKNGLLLDRYAMWKNMFSSPTIISPNVWSKLFKKDLINTVFDVRYKNGEDLKFLLEYSINCRKMLLLPQDYYNYFMRLNSAARGRDARFSDLCHGIEDVLKKIKNDDELSRLQHDADRFLLNHCLLKLKADNINPDDYYRVLAIYKKFIKRHPIRILSNRIMGFKQKIFIIMFFLSALLGLERFWKK